MRANEFLLEFELPKNRWELIVSNDDKQELGTDLVSLVRQAYSSTPQGSFVNSIKDVIPSDWNVIDWDKDPDVDSCVFYRKNRGNENWQGYKIQGLGHDGTRTSKDKALNKISSLLLRDGVWIESSDAMRHILLKLNLAPIKDEQFLQQLFNDPNLRMISNDTYVRVLADGTKVTETVFGNPKLMRANEFVKEEAKAIKTKGLTMKYAFNDRALIMKAFEPSTNNPLAYVKFVKEKKELYPQDLWVNDEYRNKGIAKTMYDSLKNDGYVINRSHDQTKAGAGFWDKHRGEDAYVWEQTEMIDEMPLPADWDPQQMRQGATTFKSRLQYALDRAKKLGTGSSRVATTIEYQGRPTVLKIAKNQKGLAQNSVEADILSDGYASQLGILIPLIDYDEQNREPSWIHTEIAQKANEKQLCSLLKCPNLSFLVNFATSITGKKRFLGLPQGYIDKLKESGMSDEDVETCTDYANTLADLNSNFDVELGDFSRAANWGLYNGKPVIVDVGFNSNVLNQYYKR
jgi:ribosomal protein S18 acetylase RimI-like enzyme